MKGPTMTTTRPASPTPMARKGDRDPALPGPSRRRRAARWVLCAAVATAVMGTASAAFSHGAGLLAAHGAILVPAAVTFAIVPGSVRRWYRWVTVLAIGYLVDQGFVSLFLLAGLTWLLHVTWVVDRPTGTRLRLPHITTLTITRRSNRG